MKRVYLDNNASTPLRPNAQDAMIRSLNVYGNPSSVHGEGRDAGKQLHQARNSIAYHLKAKAKNVTFTSGATEAAANLLKPNTLKKDGRFASHLIMTASDHACVVQGHKFPEDRVEFLEVDEEGVIKQGVLSEKLQRWSESNPDQLALVCVHAANNETGVLQPLNEIADILHTHKAIFVCDAVQVIGKSEVNLADAGVDIAFISAHKFGGPKGVGAIIRYSEDIALENPLISGGGQELSQRSGTENLSGIVAMATALDDALFPENIENAQSWKAWRDEFENELMEISPDVKIFGRNVERISNTSCFAVPGMRAETAIIDLDLAGFAVSSGSACSSGKVSKSHVLSAMNVGKEYENGAIRVSLGWKNTKEDLNMFLKAWKITYNRYKKARKAG